MFRYAPRARFYDSRPPHGGPDLQATDGLDGLIVNGREVGAEHRQVVRRQAEQVRQREATLALLGWDEA